MLAVDTNVLVRLITRDDDKQVAAAEQFFAGMALERIEVTSGPTHLTAHHFYRHLGYEDQGVRFAKPLDPRPRAG